MAKEKGGELSQRLVFSFLGKREENDPGTIIQGAVCGVKSLVPQGRDEGHGGSSSPAAVKRKAELKIRTASTYVLDGLAGIFVRASGNLNVRDVVWIENVIYFWRGILHAGA